MSERLATKVQQGNLTFYLTSLTGREIATRGFYNIERFDSGTGQGYQRLLDQRRANELARFLLDAWEKNEFPAIPTPAFLATEMTLDFDSDRNVLTIDPDAVCPFNVVDGQHRLEGVRAAVQENPQLADFRLPVTIAVELSEDHQMYHFFVINSTQKSVEQSLQQRITANFITKYNIADMPSLPLRLQREVGRGTQAGATEMVEHLNREESSPLRGRVQLVDDGSPIRGRLKEAPLANVLKQHVYIANNPIYGRELQDRMCRIIVNYLSAIDLYYDKRNEEREDLLIFRTSGIYFFIALSKWFFAAVYNTTDRDFRVDSQLRLFERMADDVDDDMRHLFDPQWWVSGRGGSSMNRATANTFVTRCNDVLRRIQGGGDEGAKV